MEKLRKSGEDYLEAILVLKKEKGVVRSIDIAHHMEYSKPSVSRAVSNLRKEGYLEMASDGELTLTETGLAAAQNIYDRHTVLAGLLVQLGVPPEIAAEDACGMEHVISKETFEQLKAHHERVSRPKAGGEEKKADDKDKKKKKKKKK